MGIELLEGRGKSGEDGKAMYQRHNRGKLAASSSSSSFCAFWRHHRAKLICLTQNKQVNENVFSRTVLTVSFSIKPNIASFRPDFCCNFGNLGKNNVFCGKIANTHPTKELKAFFAFAESLPTSATLKSSIFLKQTCEFNSLACSKFYTYNQVHFVCLQSRYKYLATSA